MQSDVRNDIPRLQSMLAKLNLKRKHPKTDSVNLHPETACKSVFYHALEPEEGIKYEDDRKDSKVISDEEQPTRSSEQKMEMKLLKRSKSFQMRFLNGRGRVYSLTLCP